MAGAAQALLPYEPFLTRPLREVATDLESFASLLTKWNRAQNLVSRETLPSLWSRHVADSLQVLPALGYKEQAVLDLGSGGGFPAIPLAIATQGRCRFVLTEPVGKKASFLRAVSRELDLGLRVEARRAQALPATAVPDLGAITARALAPLPVLLELASPFLSPPVRGLFLKGREYVDELTESRACWRFDVLVHPSRTNVGAALLEIGNLSRLQK